ncbi:family 16 glycosylhydrolase, partial [Thiorhodococcus minor]
PEDPSVYGLNKKEGWYWPNCGEIDIVEHLGHQLGVAHAAVHSKDAYFKNGGERSEATEIAAQCHGLSA